MFLYIFVVTFRFPEIMAPRSKTPKKSEPARKSKRSSETKDRSLLGDATEKPSGNIKKSSSKKSKKSDGSMVAKNKRKEKDRGERTLEDQIKDLKAH